ncbi:conserved hypothetical protein [Talaromyces stipitatus ATCC 10500]|uniref:Uncharacterized protein n=1 Tax=Talaromyces stipitatus (strain ATCC 10500 / CBS 375.48 / QM 6759 / NRRL 1006) TaxID=441959 RepID=B8M0I7_TALSN|nr:uncharacterized protein TSTA_085150 [Talaromyces stipitatus ATCC 10500]EED21284.1 conserved hypothetical protein [Talaromyces stipitatus ATCC 10500]
MFGRRTRTTRTTKPTLMTRLKGPNARHKTYKTEVTRHGHGSTTTTGATRRRRGYNHHTTTRTAPAHHHRRRPSLGDKISGAMMRLKGSLTGRPAEKAAGTRRMRGTDGRGSRRAY